VLQLIQYDIQLRAQYRHRTGFPLSDKNRNQPGTNVQVKLENRREKWAKKYWKMLDSGKGD
jgi:hypothetical protein